MLLNLNKARDLNTPFKMNLERQQLCFDLSGAQCVSILSYPHAPSQWGQRPGRPQGLPEFIWTYLNAVTESLEKLTPRFGFIGFARLGLQGLIFLSLL